MRGWWQNVKLEEAWFSLSLEEVQGRVCLDRGKSKGCTGWEKRGRKEEKRKYLGGTWISTEISTASGFEKKLREEEEQEAKGVKKVSLWGGVGILRVTFVVSYENKLLNRVQILQPVLGSLNRASPCPAVMIPSASCEVLPNCLAVL